MQKFLPVLLGIILASPVGAFAETTHHYVCTDFTTQSPWSCSSDSLDSTGWTSGGQDAYAYDINWSGTVYISYTTTQTNTRIFGEISGEYNLSGNQTDYAINTGGGGIDFNVHQTSEKGVISNICVSDTIGACAGGGGGGGSATSSTSTAEQMTASSTLMIATSNVVFQAFVIFIISAIAAVWIFKTLTW